MKYTLTLKILFYIFSNAIHLIHSRTMTSTQLTLLLLIGSIVRLWSFSPSWCASCYKTVLRPKSKSHRFQIQSEAGDGNDIISVSITKRFPNATPKQAKNAWIEYHYRKGGGLPIFIVTSDESPAERTILPTMMKETLMEDYKSEGNQSFAEISYTVTDAGPLFPGIIPNSHSAKVTFERTNQVTVMKWDVSFETTKLYALLYQAITQWTVGIAATTVEECLVLPRRLSVKTVIDEDIDPILARKECLDFVWANGGGLPLIPPIPFGDILKEGGGSARRNLLRIPPLITESIIGTAEKEGQASFQYQLNSPGWTTFPFLLHTHIGSVSFTSTTKGLAIDWEVEFRPYQMFAKSIIEKLVEMTVTTIVRNTRVKLLEPDAIVMIKPPRDNAYLTMGFEEFGKVSKATWLGGVLESHLTDTRPTSEQVFSLIKPWTWGRCGTGDENDIVRYQWTDGQLIENNNVVSTVFNDDFCT